MEGHGRSQDERAAAREARERARIAREQGLTPESEEERVRVRGEDGWDAPDLDSMNTYGRGPNLPALGSLDVYTKRRIIAAAIGLGVLLVIFLVFVGC